MARFNKENERKRSEENETPYERNGHEGYLNFMARNTARNKHTIREAALMPRIDLQTSC